GRVQRAVAAEVTRRILARKRIPPRYLGGYGGFRNARWLSALSATPWAPRCACFMQVAGLVPAGASRQGPVTGLRMEQPRCSVARKRRSAFGFAGLAAKSRPFDWKTTCGT